MFKSESRGWGGGKWTTTPLKKSHPYIYKLQTRIKVIFKILKPQAHSKAIQRF